MNGRIYPWQESAWSTLYSLHEQGRLPHASMLCGPGGSGKLQFALHLSQTLLCESENSCGACRGCQLFAAKTHPDFLLVEPEEDSVQIKIDQVRAATRFVNLSAQQAGYKIVLFEPADSMNTSAANALLKTLEEPPPATLLILLCDKPVRLPATIASRCRRLSLTASDEAAGRTYLQQTLPDTDERSAAIALGLAAGAPLAAQSLLEEDILALRQSVLDDLTLLSRDITSIGAVSARLLNVGLETLAILLPSLVRDALLLALPSRNVEILHSDLAKGLNRLIKSVDLMQLAQVPERIQNLAAQRHRASGLREDMLIDDLLGFWAEKVSSGRV